MKHQVRLMKHQVRLMKHQVRLVKHQVRLVNLGALPTFDKLSMLQRIMYLKIRSNKILIIFRVRPQDIVCKVKTRT